MEKNIGKVREFCQSGKMGTMVLFTRLVQPLVFLSHCTSVWLNTKWYKFHTFNTEESKFVRGEGSKKSIGFNIIKENMEKCLSRESWWKLEHMNKKKCHCP